FQNDLLIIYQQDSGFFVEIIHTACRLSNKNKLHLTIKNTLSEKILAGMMNFKGYTGSVNIIPGLSNLSMYPLIYFGYIDNEKASVLFWWCLKS
ncbi:MAG: hypothetical protein KAS40_03785, partial [Desulfobacterales bacterium]|nr:hypothetical protein [Desulfobacterales bacterium]